MPSHIYISALIYLLAATPLAADPLHDELSGLRISSYRAPVPETVPGGQTIDLGKLVALRDEGAMLIDVMGAPGHQIRKDGSWVIATPHRTIPGAIWLPETGHGRLEAKIEDYLDIALADCPKTRAIVVFCRSDCWMSWNVVQHISKLEFTNISWFPGGLDEWIDAQQSTENATPYTGSVCRSAK